MNGEPPKFVADGMTIDSEGFLYVAWFGSSKVLKINPKYMQISTKYVRHSCLIHFLYRSGAIELEIELPVAAITSVAFGGSQLDVLYVTTASIKLGENDLGEQLPTAGSLFAVTGLGVKGLPMANVRV